MSGKPLHILLVEDNPINQMMAKGVVESLSHRVDTAENGEDALTKARDGGYDLILMDLNMPVMDGFQAARAIRDHYGENGPPILALSATLEEEERTRCRECGMNGWLKKPLEPEELKEKLESLRAPQKPSPPPVLPLKTEQLVGRIQDREALARIVGLFSSSFPQRLTEIELSLNAEGSELAKRTAHTLKGNFLNFGSPHGAMVAQSLEYSLDEGRWDDARELLAQVREECYRVEKALQTILAERKDPVAPARVEENPFSVLLADIDPANRAVCAACLKGEGYQVTELDDGEEVLRALERGAYDVVLMGAFLNSVGGFETCRRIKAGESTRVVPVLLVTAMGERDARIEGMDAGADDFITKPIDPQEVSLRVRNAARGKELYDQVQKSFQDLKRLEELRDGLTHMLVHDLRGPLTSIKGYAQLLVSGFGEGLTPEQKNCGDKIVAQSNRLVEMVSAILDVSKLESDQMPLELATENLSALLKEVADQYEGLPDFLLRLEMDEELSAPCDGELIKRVVGNLLSNAFKYTPKEKEVLVRLSGGTDTALIEVVDHGPGVPPEQRDKIFEKFAQVEGKTHKRPYSSGLGLTFCHLVVEKHGGRIGVGDGYDGEGSRFWLTLPR